MKGILTSHGKELRINSNDNHLLELPISDLALDSIETLELIMGLEDLFNVKIDETAASKCQLVKDLITLVLSND